MSAALPGILDSHFEYTRKALDYRGDGLTQGFHLGLAMGGRHA